MVQKFTQTLSSCPGGRQTGGLRRARIFVAVYVLFGLPKCSGDSLSLSARDCHLCSSFWVRFLWTLVESLGCCWELCL